MSDICGLVTTSGDLPVGDILRRVYGASWHEGYVGEELWQGRGAALGHAGIGSVNPGPQPVCSDDGRYALVYCGKIFDYAGLADELAREGIKLARPGYDPEFVLYWLTRRPTAEAARLNGVFSAAVWDSLAGRLRLVTDRMGYRPLYYWHDRGRGVLVFSSYLRGVMASGLAPVAVNWPACSTFLHFGHHLGDETSFRGVQLVPPGSVLTWDKQGVRIDRYWNPAEVAVDAGMTYAEAIEGANHHFARAIRRRNIDGPGPKMVFLSGGLDSRRIAAELRRQGGRFSTWTTRGFDPLTDNRTLARQVAEALGVENRFVNLPRDNFLREYWPRSNAETDYETVLHQWILPLVDTIPPGGVNFDGIAGDILFNGVRRLSEFTDPERFAAAQAADAATLAKQIVPEAMDFSVLAPEIRRNLSAEAPYQAVKRQLEQLGGTPNRLTLFYLLNRTRRAVALGPMKLVKLKAECFLPYLDNDFLEFMLSIPPETKIARPLRRETVERAYPPLRDIGCTAYVPASRHRRRRADDIAYHSQRRRNLLRNIRLHFLQNNWMFDNLHSAPKLLKDLAMSYLLRGHVSYVFNVSFTVFYSWLGRYFPGRLEGGGGAK